MRIWLDIREQMLRLAALLRRNQTERDLAKELEFHLVLKQQKYADEYGLDQAEAAARARRSLGNVEKWKEFCRDVGRSRPLEDFARDLALALRMLSKTPAFTAVALITLALAIGANTAIFSLINVLLLRPLDVPEADRLTLLRIQPDEFGYTFNYPLFKYVESHADAFSEVFAFASSDLQVHGRDGIERVAGQLVSGGYFAALKVNPEVGRYIVPADDRPGVATAVISDRFWRNWFGGDPRVLGRKIVLNNVVVTVVGVMPPKFRGAAKDARPDVFLPFELEPLIDAPFNNIAGGSHSWWFHVGARLRSGTSLDQANAFLRASSQAAFKATLPDSNFRFNGHTRSELLLIAEPGTTGYSYLRLRFRKPLNALMLLVALVLVIACLNLATLLMARAASREREMATRFALGASRTRLLRQLLTESMLLAITGTALGSVASPLLSNLLIAFLTSHQPLQPRLDTAPDVRVLLFTAALAAVATILTGIAPAMRSTGRGLEQRMRDSSRALRGPDRPRFWPRLLLACEVGLALVLVTGAGLLGYSLMQLHEIPPGFEPRGLVLLELEMAKQPRDGKALIRAYHDIAEGLSAIPGVKAVSFVNVIPLEGSSWTGDISVPGQAKHELYRNRIGPAYFRAMHTPLLAGREFRWTDTDESGRVAILNEAAARLLFPGRSPLGQCIGVDDDPAHKATAVVVGVVANAKYTSLRDAAPPAVYSPISQDVRNKPSHAAAIRMNGSPAAVIAAARKTVRGIVPEIPPPVATTMEQTIAEALATERMMATLALFFGAAALLITGIGLYGTLAYATQRRTGEIGIRMALGAQPGSVISMVCLDNGAIALGGCLAGIPGSLAASRLIGGFLYATSPCDPLILSASALLLIGVAAGASMIPAVRASRIDPIAAIRYE
ncbi:MAG TPA: ABC transporter permease [Bryobacteraceae bacterium]|jgi:predicted permease